MSASNKGTNFLEEFKSFLAFLHNLWSILAGIAVLFPLSNALTKVIPLGNWPESGGLIYFSPELVTIVATLTPLFIIFWTYSQRRKFRAQRKRQIVQRQAWLSFALGLGVLALYLVVNFLLWENFYFTFMGWLSNDPRRLLGDVILLLTYTGFFVLVTRAFVLLGMLEFFGRES